MTYFTTRMVGCTYWETKTCLFRTGMKTININSSRRSYTATTMKMRKSIWRRLSKIWTVVGIFRCLKVKAPKWGLRRSIPVSFTLSMKIWVKPWVWTLLSFCYPKVRRFFSKATLSTVQLTEVLRGATHLLKTIISQVIVPKRA